MSWETVALGDVCRVIAGQSPEGKHYNKEGNGVPFYQGKKDFGAVYINPPTVWTTEVTKLASKGDILMSVRAPVGPVNFSSDEVCIGRGLAAIQQSSKVNRFYLFYYFLKIQNELVGSSGAVFNSINKSQIESLRIPLPPLLIQQKIVTKLDAIFAEIDKATAAAEANIKNAEALFQSYLTEVFERGGDEWSTTNLQCVVKEVITGPFGSSLHKSDYVENGVPVINPQNIINGKIIPLNKTMVSIETKERLKKFALQKKDIVIARRGEMGRCGLVDTDSEGWLCGTGSMIIRLNDKANENYIFQLLQSNRIKQQLESASIGATMNNLNQSILLGVQIALPPIEFQVKILNTIEQLSKKYFDISQIYFKKINNLTALKQSILQQAFNGELVKE